MFNLHRLTWRDTDAPHDTFALFLPVVRAAGRHVVGNRTACLACACGVAWAGQEASRLLHALLPALPACDETPLRSAAQLETDVL